jgi:hypothetical protein
MKDGPQPSIFQVIGSVISAAFGVQSAANRERDFTRGSAKPYILVGILFTVIFILTLLGVIRLVLG